MHSNLIRVQFNLLKRGGFSVAYWPSIQGFQVRFPVWAPSFWTTFPLMKRKYGHPGFSLNLRFMNATGVSRRKECQIWTTKILKNKKYCITVQHTTISARVTFAIGCFPAILIEPTSSSIIAFVSAFFLSNSSFFRSCSSYEQ